MNKFVKWLIAASFVIAGSTLFAAKESKPLENIINLPQFQPRTTEQIVSEPTLQTNSTIPDSISGYAQLKYFYDLQNLDDTTFTNQDFLSEINSPYIEEPFSDLEMEVDVPGNVIQVLKGFNDPENFMQIASENANSNEDAIIRTLFLMKELNSEFYNGTNQIPYTTGKFFNNLPQILKGEILKEDIRFVCIDIAQGGGYFAEQLSEQNDNVNLDAHINAVNSGPQLHAVLMLRDKETGEMYVTSYSQLYKSGTTNPKDPLSLYYSRKENSILITSNFTAEKGISYTTRTTDAAKKIISYFPSIEKTFGQNILETKDNEKEINITFNKFQKEIELNSPYFNIKLGKQIVPEIGYYNTLTYTTATHQYNNKDNGTQFKITLPTILAQNSNLNSTILNIFPTAYYSTTFNLSDYLKLQAGIYLSGQMVKNIKDEKPMTTRAFNSDLAINLKRSNSDNSQISHVGIGVTNVVPNYLKSFIDENGNRDYQSILPIIASRLPLSLDNIIFGTNYTHEETKIGINGEIDLYGTTPISIKATTYIQTKLLPNLSIYAELSGKKVTEEYDSRVADSILFSAMAELDLTDNLALNISHQLSSSRYCDKFTSNDSKTKLALKVK